MKKKFKVNCEKCKKEYQSEEPDGFYCEECLKHHQQVIKEIEEKMKNRPKKETVSELQQFDTLTDNRGFAKAKDLGI